MSTLWTGWNKHTGTNWTDSLGKEAPSASSLPWMVGNNEPTEGISDKCTFADKHDSGNMGLFDDTCGGPQDEVPKLFRPFMCKWVGCADKPGKLVKILFMITKNCQSRKQYFHLQIYTFTRSSSISDVDSNSEISFIGFTQDSMGVCYDIDECKDNSICGNNFCTNTFGSYTCS